MRLYCFSLMFNSPFVMGNVLFDFNSDRLGFVSFCKDKLKNAFFEACRDSIRINSLRDTKDLLAPVKTFGFVQAPAPLKGEPQKAIVKLKLEIFFLHSGKFHTGNVALFVFIPLDSGIRCRCGGAKSRSEQRRESPEMIRKQRVKIAEEGIGMGILN